MGRCVNARSSLLQDKKHLPSFCDACRFKTTLWADSLNKNNNEKAVIHTLAASPCSIFLQSNAFGLSKSYFFLCRVMLSQRGAY